MKKIIFLFLICQIHLKGHANYSCDQTLKKKLWPIDCFVLLSINKVPKNNKKYIDLNEWCKIYSPELLKQKPPKAVFSLYMPQNCLNTAWKAKNHHRSLEILNSSFLNSFP